VSDIFSIFLRERKKKEKMGKVTTKSISGRQWDNPAESYILQGIPNQIKILLENLLPVKNPDIERFERLEQCF